MAQTFGRRPVAIFSSVICLASMIWRAKATSYGSFMGACVLNGIGAGPAEVLYLQALPDSLSSDHSLDASASDHS
jgi:hypothetical protein